MRSHCFWHDHWIGPCSLAEMFPALHSHCRRPNVTVASAWSGSQWSFFLVSGLSACAAAELQLLSEALASIQPVAADQDVRGIGSAKVPFSSAKAYSWHMAKRPPDLFATFIWSNAATPRCKHLLWLAHRDRLPTAALLHRRHIVDLDQCSYCGALEDQCHILLHCPQARRVWQRLHWPAAPYLQSFRDLWGMAGAPSDAKIASTFITAILWNIWKSRNAWIFDGRLQTPEQTLHAAADDLNLWMHRVPARARQELQLAINLIPVT